MSQLSLTPAPECPACSTWNADRTSGQYVQACEQCRARAIARSPAAWRALRGESNTELREAILRNFGDDWKRGRALVWEWITRLKGGAKT